MDWLTFEYSLDVLFCVCVCVRFVLLSLYLFICLFWTSLRLSSLLQIMVVIGPEKKMLGNSLNRYFCFVPFLITFCTLDKFYQFLFKRFFFFFDSLFFIYFWFVMQLKFPLNRYTHDFWQWIHKHPLTRKAKISEMKRKKNQRENGTLFLKKEAKSNEKYNMVCICMWSHIRCFLSIQHSLSAEWRLTSFLNVSNNSGWLFFLLLMQTFSFHFFFIHFNHSYRNAYTEFVKNNNHSNHISIGKRARKPPITTHLMLIKCPLIIANFTPLNKS